MTKYQTYNPEPAGNNIHHPKNWLKKGVGHEITVEERVVAKGIKDESGVAQRLPQSTRQAAATAPGAAAHPSRQQVHGIGAQPHPDLGI